jgi:hypothetical protein
VKILEFELAAVIEEAGKEIRSFNKGDPFLLRVDVDSEPAKNINDFP